LRGQEACKAIEEPEEAEATTRDDSQHGFRLGRRAAIGATGLFVVLQVER
jgi:hypothetical protein